MEVFRIEYGRGRKADYATLDAARKVANEIFRQTGIVVGIIRATR